MYLVTPDQMKYLEKKTDENGCTYKMLMQNAGTKLAEFIIKEAELKNLKKDIVFLCGNGNNAGDCFIAANYLSSYGWKLKIALLCGLPKTNISLDAFKSLKNICIIDNTNEIIEAVKDSSIIVDGVFGTGFHGEMPENIKAIFNNISGFKIAVDVPSGGNCSTGCISDGNFYADATVTFGYKKFGMEQFPLKAFCGKVYTADIGIDKSCINELTNPIIQIDEAMINKIIPKRNPDAHKGSFGKLLTVTGSLRMPGASIMSNLAALRCGAGLVVSAVCSDIIAGLMGHIFEAMFLPLTSDKDGFMIQENYNSIIAQTEKSTAVLIGCGIGVTDETKQLVKKLIKNIRCPIILDADGLNCISDSIDIIREVKSSIIITPHPAEMARLSGITTDCVQRNRLETAAKFAEQTGAIVVLKGAGTVISAKGKTYVNSTGNSGMSKGGSGDVLAGMLASFIAQGIKPEDAAVLSVYLHGKAGDNAAEKLSKNFMLPRDIINELSGLLKNIEEN